MPAFTVLYIDSDPARSELVCRRLGKECGAAVGTAPSAASALSWLAGSACETIIDGRDQRGADGIDLARAIRHAGIRVPLIAITSAEEGGSAAAALCSGADACIVRTPGYLRELEAAVSAIRRGEIASRPGAPAGGTAPACAVSPAQARIAAAAGGTGEEGNPACTLLSDGTIAGANPAFASACSRTAEALFGTPFFFLIPEPERTAVMEQIDSLGTAVPVLRIAHALAGSAGPAPRFLWEYRALIGRDGRIAAYRVSGRPSAGDREGSEGDAASPRRTANESPGPAPQEGSPGAGGNGRDGSGPQAREIAGALETLDCPAFAIDRTGRIIAWNAAIARLTGTDAAAMAGRGGYAHAIPFYGRPRPMLADYLVMPAAEAVAGGGLQGIVQDGETFTGGEELVWIRGCPQIIQAKAGPVRDRQGTVTAAIQMLVVRSAPSSVTAVTGRVTQPGRKAAGGTATARPAADPVTAPSPQGSTALLPSRPRALQGGTAGLADALACLIREEDELVRNCEYLRQHPAPAARNGNGSGAFLTRVIGNARDGILAYDRGLRITLWNRFMEDLTGIPAASVIGSNVIARFPALGEAGIGLLMERALTGDTAESADFSFPYRGTGRPVWVRAVFSALQDDDRAITGGVGIVQDITAKKVLEHALQTTIAQLMESEEKYRNVFTLKNDPLLLVDTATRAIVEANEAACLLYGYEAGEMTALALGDLSAEPEKTEEAIRSRAPVVRQRLHRKKDGSVFSADITSAYFAYRGRQVLVLSVRDITPLQQSAEALRVANTKLSLLIGITRHDVLNKMTALKGYTELLKARTGDPACAALVAGQEAVLDAVCRQIEFTREYDELGASPPLWQDPGAAARKAREQFDTDIPFRCEVPGLEISADRMLEKVFYNLFDNTFRHGGAVTCTRLRCVREPSGLRLVFEDNGDGIPPAEKERIFQRGVGKNTGLGLFLAREILSITRIGIAETGTYGKGARFEMAVPPGAYRVIPGREPAGPAGRPADS